MTPSIHEAVDTRRPDPSGATPWLPAVAERRDPPESGMGDMPLSDGDIRRIATGLLLMGGLRATETVQRLTERLREGGYPQAAEVWEHVIAAMTAIRVDSRPEDARAPA